MPPESDYGWTQHIDKTGSPCAYCGKPSTHTLIVEPDQYRNEALVRRGKRVGLCDEHWRPVQEPAPSANFRRRKDREAEQTTMDLGDGHGQSGNAILGDQAA
jgi:hypothetical protein